MNVNDPRLGRFVEWLKVHGSCVRRSSPGDGELLRFTTPQGEGVIHSAGDEISGMTGGAADAWDAFSLGRAWHGSKRARRKHRGRKRRLRLVRSLAHRDGWRCAYCGELLTEGSATIEHVLPVSRGGPEDPANLTLTCRLCNHTLGSFSVRQKIDFAVSHRRGALSS